MQDVETRLQSHSGIHKMPLGFIKVSTKIAPSTSYSTLKKESAKKHTTKPSLSEKNVAYTLPQQELQNQAALFDEPRSQAKHCISLIEDPLWKHVCTEVISMMGPLSVLKIWNSRLGSPQEKMIDLYCQTEEAEQFIQQYAFVIIDILQQFFPTLKELNVKSESTALY